MALTNLPYDDEKIVEAVRTGGVKRQELRDVHVDFLSTDLGEEAEATVSATYTWTISAADAVRVLADAVPGPDTDH